MITVKLSHPPWPIVRQTPGQSGTWGECRFFCNIDINQCDYWFVLESPGSKKETALCPKTNTVFIAGEPPTIKTYQREFLDQFAAVISSDININHPHPIFQQSGLPWHVGRRQRNHINIQFTKDYDELKGMTSIPKRKLLSVVTSSKIMTEGHRRRFEFARQLKTHFGDKIDLFGRGLNEIEDKWDALADYRYHVAIENSEVKHYWTEKLADAFLAGCYPIYHGCPNITDYFSPESFSPININDPKKAITVIESCMEQNKYESSLRRIWESREKVLDRYNLFALIAEYIAEDRRRADGNPRPPVPVTIKKEPSDSNLIRRFKKKLLRL
ncbi:MAG TPA: glycosyltransferase family 10 [Smithellaceae bacterium]|nr:glycosyltransferase family 10 [Smithellaceae bacterium]